MRYGSAYPSEHRVKSNKRKYENFSGYRGAGRKVRKESSLKRSSWRCDKHPSEHVTTAVASPGLDLAPRRRWIHIIIKAVDVYTLRLSAIGARVLSAVCKTLYGCASNNM